MQHQGKSVYLNHDNQQTLTVVQGVFRSARLPWQIWFTAMVLTLFPFLWSWRSFLDSHCQAIYRTAWWSPLSNHSILMWPYVRLPHHTALSWTSSCLIFTQVGLLFVWLVQNLNLEILFEKPKFVNKLISSASASSKLSQEKHAAFLHSWLVRCLQSFLTQLT